MNKKRILLLGGSHGQLPAIYEAKNRGLYTILCDYLTDNPGRSIADQYYNISTTDHLRVTDIAKRESINAVFAFASDPAASTAAYVAEKLGLKSSSLESIIILSEKDRFRTMQKTAQFNAPEFLVLSEVNIHQKIDISLNYPLVVKPVDSSDTKGVFKVNNEKELWTAAEISVTFSKKRKIIIEEFIDAEMANLHGDAFFLEGKMIFCMLGDRLFGSLSNPLKPSTELYPSRLSKKWIKKVEKEIAAVVFQSGFRNGPVNVEARIDISGKIYVMEIGPRSGGTLTPQAIYYSTGFDMLKASLDLLLGESVAVQKKNINPVICFALHSNREGKFVEFRLDKNLRGFVAEQHIYVQAGDLVKPYSEPGSTIGVLLFSFPNWDQVNNIIPDLYQKVLSGIMLN